MRLFLIKRKNKVNNNRCRENIFRSDVSWVQSWAQYIYKYTFTKINWINVSVADTTDLLQVHLES